MIDLLWNSLLCMQQKLSRAANDIFLGRWNLANFLRRAAGFFNTGFD